MPTELRLASAKIPVKLYQRLDRYWHDKRLPSRSVAIRQAIEEMLDRDAEARRQPRKDAAE